TPPESGPIAVRDIRRIDPTSTGTATPDRAGESAVGPPGSATFTAPPGLDLSSPGPLAAVDEELGLLRSLEAWGARVERLPALRQAVRRGFGDGAFDLLPRVSHGSFSGSEAGDASAVFLDDGLFTAADLSPRMAGALRRAAPLVIFNTCHCGRMGFSLTR